jgi:hypothetical protein
MKAALTELNQLSASWKRLMAARPGEMDFSPYSFGGLTGAEIDSSITSLIEILDLHQKKTKAVDGSGFEVVEAGIVRSLHEMRPWVDSAQGNGLPWLLNSTEFLSRLSFISLGIQQSVGRNVDLRKRIARLAADDLQGNITLVQNSADAAKRILDESERVAQSEQHVLERKQQIDAIREELNGILAEARKVAESSATSKTEIDGINANILDAQKSTLAAKNSAEQDAAALKDSLGDLNGSIEESLGKSQEATELLDKALADVRRQGLAKAFSDRYRAARWEYVSWTAIFLVALAAFGVLGTVQFTQFLNATPAASDMQLSGLLLVARRLLIELPLVIPIVWLGWYSAKRVGRVSRLVQDYEYKAATALAFESYKNEAKLLGSDELSGQLLATAIKNFGDNPVRLLDGSDKDHGHPLEAIVDMLKDKKAAERLLAIIELIGGRASR